MPFQTIKAVVFINIILSVVCTITILVFTRFVLLRKKVIIIFPLAIVLLKLYVRYFLVQEYFIHLEMSLFLLLFSL